MRMACGSFLGGIALPCDMEYVCLSSFTAATGRGRGQQRAVSLPSEARLVL